MISVFIEGDDGPAGEMRIELLETHPDGKADYAIQYAADSGGGWVDAKQRVLYGFNAQKYNALALVSEALNLLDLKDMEMTDATDHPGRLARRQLGSGEEVPGETRHPVGDHRPALRSGQSEQLLRDAGRQEDGTKDRER